jgi:hypothetical protein
MHSLWVNSNSIRNLLKRVAFSPHLTHDVGPLLAS